MSNYENELRKYIYEALQKGDTPKFYDMFWNYISFPPESGNEIVFPNGDEVLIASYNTFKKFIKEAERQFYEDKLRNNQE